MAINQLNEINQACYIHILQFIRHRFSQLFYDMLVYFRAPYDFEANTIEPQNRTCDAFEGSDYQVYFVLFWQRL